MSTRTRIYLDFNATAPLGDAARTAMIAAMGEVGNPSSIHGEGRRARDRVEVARRQVATFVGRPAEQIVFTSGGTEANIVGLHALARAAERRGLPRTILTARTHHPSLLGAIDALAAHGWAVVSEASQPVGLVAYTLVNHEVGFIDDVARIGDALVHVDAVQAAGKLRLDVPADSIALSGHKLGGPQGIGALAISVDEALPIVGGGHQERGRRPGTENVLGIVGFGAAAAAADPTSWSRVAALGEQLKQGVLAIDGARITETAHQVGGTINAAFAGALGQSIVIALDLEGIAVSTGAACTSGSVQPSPVLLALGQTPVEAREAVRFSLGRTTTAEAIDHVLAVLPAIVERARKHR